MNPIATNKVRISILALLLIIFLQSCTRNPFDPEEPATFNRDEFVFRKIQPATALRALSVAGNSAGVLSVAAMTFGGEIVLLTDEQGQWAEIGRIVASTSSVAPILDIAPDLGGYWFVLVSDDWNGVVLHHTNGIVHTEQTIPRFMDGDWGDVCGQLETTAAGNPSAVLLARTGSVVLCVRGHETWTHHNMLGLTISAEPFSYRIDPVNQHHVLYHDSFEDAPRYRSFNSGAWTPAEDISNGGGGAYAGEPIELSVSEFTNVRVIGFHYSRNVLVMWEHDDTSTQWDAEGLPIAEDTLMDRYLSATTAPDGTPHVMVARFNGATRYELLWLSRLSSWWEVHTVASGLHRMGQFNPIRLAAMAMAGDVPHLVFAELNPGGEQVALWDATPR